MTNLYPAIEPYQHGYLDVGDGHNIYYEQSGNPEGLPVIFLHGGPGSGTTPTQRQFFNPDIYRIILFDQRGSGKSTPHGSLNHNTTAHLIADMESLRTELKIPKWLIFGGSWGSTLGICYAMAHPKMTLGLILYGIFLGRTSELKALYYPGGVVHNIFPDYFEPYLEYLPPEHRDDPLRGYKTLFESPNEEVRFQALYHWTALEKRVAALEVSDEDLKTQVSDPNFIIAHSLIENHYFLSNCFIDGDAILKKSGTVLSNIPTHIIAGRYDLVCPHITAYQLHKSIPHSQLTIIPNAGHTWKETKTAPEIIRACDQMAQKLA